MWVRASLVAILGTAVVGSTLALTRPDYSFFDPIIDVERLIAQRYVTDPDLKAMQQAAISGMVESLNDPYTIYVPPVETREFTKELTGEFVGIGVQVVTRDGWLTVVTPLEDTPAFRAGIMAEDRIVEIEGKSTAGLTSDDCINLLTGVPGTPVKLVIERKGQKIPFTIPRERIVTKTVKGFHFGGAAGSPGAPAKNSASAAPEAGPGWNYILDPSRRIAYIRFTQFTPTSAEEITQTLESLGARDGKLGGLILDLRWNPGGVLSDAIQIADLFLSDGVIVSTRGRAHTEEVARATKEGTLPDFPLVLLINSGSASASEVLAGALTEQKRAIAVGTRSFGKGSVQTVISLPSGQGQLKMTEQRYYLPSGRSIHRSENSATWGVDPTDGYYVPMTDDQVRDMLTVRQQEEIIASRDANADPGQWSNADWILGHLKDPQLAAGLKAVQARVDTGNWIPTGDPLPQDKDITSKELERLSRLRDRMEKELTRLDRRIDALEENASLDDQPGLLPKDAEIAGGRIDIFDKDGKKVSTLRITGNDLERWLQEAEVKPEGAADDKNAPKRDAKGDAKKGSK
jgi:carboxyl-terminal processing protease